MKLRSFVAVLAFALLAAAPVAAAPPVGAQRTAVSLVDAWDRTLAVAAKGTKAMLVVYEDKGSAQQNILLKRELGRLAKSGAATSSVSVVPIADVTSFSVWPVRGFVKDAIKSESEKAGTPIYCDWDGAARKALGLRAGVSNVVFYDRDGKVVFAREGTLSAEDRATLLNLIRGQLGTS